MISFSIFSVIKIKIQSGDLHQYFDKRIDFISDIFINTTRIHVWNLDYTELERNIRTSLKMEENLKAIFIKLGSTDSSFIAGEKEDKENIKIFQGNSHKKKYLQKFERASIKKLEQDIYYYNENIGAVHFFFDKKYIEREIKKEISSLVIQFISLAVVLFIGVYFAIQRIIIKPLYIFKEISDLITKKVTGIQKDISKDKDSIYSEKLMVPESIYYNEKLSEEKDEFGQLYNSFVTLIETINIQLNIIIDYSKGLESKVRQRTAELKKAQSKMLEQAHKAGMAELASSTLHNIGNAVNSLMNNIENLNKNNSNIRTMKKSYDKILKLIDENKNELEEFFNSDPTGKRVISIFKMTNDEMQKNIEKNHSYAKKNLSILNHVIEIINVQNSYAQGVKAIKEKININKLITDSLEILSESLKKRKIKIKKDLSFDKSIHINKNNLMQVIVNMIKNSIESIDAKQSQMKGKSDDMIKIVTKKMFNYFVIKIKDSGVGFQNNIKNELFSFKFSTKTRGTGFGLHFSANFIKNNKGNILAFSKGENTGATFIIILPLKGGKNEI